MNQSKLRLNCGVQKLQYMWLTLVRRRNGDGLSSELVVEVASVRFWRHLRFEGRIQLQREKNEPSENPHQLSARSHGTTFTFFCSTSSQFIEEKNLCDITSLASSGPPPSLQPTTSTLIMSFPPCCVMKWCGGGFTSVWGLSSADLWEALWLQAWGFWGNGSPPSQWAQRAARDPDYRRAVVRTSFRTSLPPNPTSPLLDRNHCPPEPVDTHTSQLRGAYF